MDSKKISEIEYLISASRYSESEKKEIIRAIRDSILYKMISIPDMPAYNLKEK